MYTIIMNSDKSLTTSIRTTLYQREKLVDKIQFLFPQKYEDIEIKNCTILLKYIDQGNVAHAERLVIDDELYKERVRCVVNIDTNLTRFAGNINIHLDFLKLNSDKGIYESVLSSGETIITISPLNDYFAYCADESLDIINKTVLELDAKTKALEAIAETLSDKKADNITYEDDKLQLSANGQKIGDAITIKSSEGGGVDEEGIPIVDFGISESDDNPEENPDNSDDERDVVEF